MLVLKIMFGNIGMSST